MFFNHSYLLGLLGYSNINVFFRLLPSVLLVLKFIDVVVNIIVNINNWHMFFADILSCIIVVSQDHLYIIFLVRGIQSFNLFNIQSLTIANIGHEIISHLLFYSLYQIFPDNFQYFLGSPLCVFMVDDSKILMIIYFGSHWWLFLL